MHELKELHDLLNYEFEEGSVKPKCASGTRWIGDFCLTARIPPSGRTFCFWSNCCFLCQLAMQN